MVIDELITAIETLKFPVLKQGSLTHDNDYPKSFFTFWNNESSGNSFYDNEEHTTNWYYTLCFYSSDVDVYDMILLAKKALKEAGFIVTGKGYDVSSDVITHTGRAIDVLYIEKKEEQ